MKDILFEIHVLVCSGEEGVLFETPTGERGSSWERHKIFVSVKGITIKRTRFMKTQHSVSHINSFSQKSSKL